MEDLVIWGAARSAARLWRRLRARGRFALLVDADVAHVAALNANGLKITGPIADYATPARALSRRGAGTLKRVMLAVKGQHTAAAARAMRRCSPRTARYCRCQNGLTGAGDRAGRGAASASCWRWSISRPTISSRNDPCTATAAASMSESRTGRITPRVTDYVALLKQFDHAMRGHRQCASASVGQDCVWRACSPRRR